MRRALLFLLVASFLGRIRRGLRLARQPKYLLGFVVGVAYLGWLVFRPLLTSEWSGAELERVPPEIFRGLHILAAMAIAFYLSFGWAFLPAGPGLRLREAELHLLLTAPIERRRVIQYALVKHVPGLLVGTGIAVLFLANGPPHARALQAVNILCLFFLWDLHGKGRNLWKARMRELPPAAALPRRTAMGAFIVVFWAVAGACAVRLTRILLAALGEGGGDVERTMERAVELIGRSTESGVLRTLLAPLLWLTEPFFSETRLGSPVSWTFLGVTLAAHYFWVVRAETSFEETLLDQERRKAAGGTRGARRRLGQSEARRRLRPFPLGPVGRPETAVFWKDLVQITRRPVTWFAWGGLVLLATVAAAVAVLGAPRWLLFPLGIGGTVVFAGSAPLAGLMWSNGFRRDLRHVEALRAWPLTGPALVRGEMSAPLVQSAAAMALGLLLVAGAELGHRAAGWIGLLPEAASMLPLDWAEALGVPRSLLLPLVVSGLLPVLGAVAVVSSAVECAAVLLFPGWLLVLDSQRSDPSSLGQKILMSLAFFLVLFLGILPGVLGVGGVVLLQTWLGYPVSGWEFPLLGLLVAAPLAAEALLLVRAAGRLWESMDPARELLEGFS